MIKNIIRFLRAWKRKLYTRYYTWRVKRQAKTCGDFLIVNGKSRVSPNTYISNHVNFNGMQISGGGKCGLEIIFILVQNAL